MHGLSSEATEGTFLVLSQVLVWPGDRRPRSEIDSGERVCSNVTCDSSMARCPGDAEEHLWPQVEGGSYGAEGNSVDTECLYVSDALLRVGYEDVLEGGGG